MAPTEVGRPERHGRHAVQYEILNRWTSNVQVTAQIECAEDAAVSVKLGLAVKWAISTDADLSDADISHADLSGANLSRADLTGADLGDADISRANLSRADLSDANLSRANLSGAYLGDANLGDAENLGQVIWDIGRKMVATIAPVFFEGGTLPVMVTDGHIKIGCQIHTTVAWAAFDGAAIARMSSGVPEFWAVWKAPILSLAAAHQARVADTPATESAE